MKNSYLYDNVSLPAQPILALTDRDGFTEHLSPAQNEYVRRPRAIVENGYNIVTCEVSMTGATLLLNEQTQENKVGPRNSSALLISVEADGKVTRGRVFHGMKKVSRDEGYQRMWLIRDMLE